MAICDKINTAGQTLQSNLNARGVSCTYGKNSENKQTLKDMADLITASNLKGSNDALISISASRPYLLSGEKTDLIVKLVNGLGQPLANKSVSISDGTSVYSGITNNNGTYTKMGVSVNTVTNFTATYNTVNSSECTVYPCIYRDYATSDNKSNYYINGAGGTTLTWSNEYYVLGLGSSSNYVDLKSITDNVKGKTVNFKVDVVLNGASIRLRVFNEGTPLASSAYTTSDGTVKVENVAIPSDATSILFRIERRYLTDGDSIKFKNFRIYSI